MQVPHYSNKANKTYNSETDLTVLIAADTIPTIN